MTKEAKKIWTVVGVIASVVVVSVLIQWGRFYSKAKSLTSGTAIVLPSNYFPFNGTYSKDASGKTMKG